MEKEEGKERTEQKEQFKKKRIVSIFRKRKKTDIRPFVRETRQRRLKKILLYFFIFVILIFFLSGFLFVLRFIVIPKLFEARSAVILSPVDRNQLQNTEIEDLISGSGLDISDITYADLTVNFILHRNTKVFLSTVKDIKTQLNLL